MMFADVLQRAFASLVPIYTYQKKDEASRGRGLAYWDMPMPEWGSGPSGAAGGDPGGYGFAAGGEAQSGPSGFSVGDYYFDGDGNPIDKATYDAAKQAQADAHQALHDAMAGDDQGSSADANGVQEQQADSPLAPDDGNALPPVPIDSGQYLADNSPLDDGAADRLDVGHPLVGGEQGQSGASAGDANTDGTAVGDKPQEQSTDKIQSDSSDDPNLQFTPGDTTRSSGDGTDQSDDQASAAQTTRKPADDPFPYEGTNALGAANLFLIGVAKATDAAVQQIANQIKQDLNAPDPSYDPGLFGPPGAIGSGPGQNYSPPAQLSSQPTRDDQNSTPADMAPRIWPVLPTRGFDSDPPAQLPEPSHPLKVWDGWLFSQARRQLQDQVSKPGVGNAEKYAGGFIGNQLLGPFADFEQLPNVFDEAETGGELIARGHLQPGIGASIVDFGAGSLAWIGAALTLFQIAAVIKKPINLPASNKVTIDMDHIASGHMIGGSRLSPGSTKDLFPPDWTRAQVEKAIKEAYSSAQRLKSQDGSILLVGRGGGIDIKMWLNLETKQIETAFPDWSGP